MPRLASIIDVPSTWTLAIAAVALWAGVTFTMLVTAPKLDGPPASEALAVSVPPSASQSGRRLQSDIEALAVERTPSIAATGIELAGPPPAPLAQAEFVQDPVSMIVTGPRGGPLSTQGQDLYNCADFTSWEHARAVFEASEPGDPNRIDIDRNGIPCEALKAATGR